MCGVNPNRASVWRTELHGDPVNRFFALTLGPAVALGTACASPGVTDETPDSMGLGSPIMLEGTVYIPVSQGDRGCLLYSVRIPGGQAPAALVYRSVEGQFSYDRPEKCVRSAVKRYPPRKKG